MNNKFFHIFFIIFFLSVGCFIQSTSSYLLQLLSSEFELARSFETSNSYIGVVRHKKTKTLYIVKQKKNKMSICWSIVQAILAYEYANSTQQILSQRVYIIPKNISFPGKKYQNEFASLHTIVPGMSVRSWQQSIKRGIDLKKVAQLVIDFSIKLQEDIGINEHVIQTMTRHNDLSPIVALHLLVGFYDCHNKNIFYDYYKNRFSIIDMDSCYRFPLASFSYEVLRNILTRKELRERLTLSRKMQNVLLNFADMIELMIERNSIKKINEILLELFDLLKIGDSEAQEILMKKLMKIDPFLQQSYESGKKIVALIRTVCQQASKTELVRKVPPRYCIVGLYDNENELDKTGALR